MSSKRKPTATYTDREREIFRYWDGSREIGADPLELQMRLTQIDGTDLGIDVKLARGSTSEAPKAVQRLVEAVRIAFAVQPFTEVDGKAFGLTSTECLQLLARFGDYVAGLKKKLPSSRTSPSATACPDQPVTPSSAASS